MGMFHDTPLNPRILIKESASASIYVHIFYRILSQPMTGGSPSSWFLFMVLGFASPNCLLLSHLLREVYTTNFPFFLFLTWFRIIISIFFVLQYNNLIKHLRNVDMKFMYVDSVAHHTLLKHR
jgi:hypothetical protein